MSQVLTPRTGTPGEGPPAPGPTGRRGTRLVLLIVLLSLLVGTAVGWAAYTVATTSDGPSARSLDAQQARYTGAAERFLQQADAERWLVEQRRWEAQADRYAPGWRDQ
jgi:Tfp pilus assembly protein PilX